MMFCIPQPVPNICLTNIVSEFFANHKRPSKPVVFSHVSACHSITPTGLTMELFIERDEYLSSLQQSAGLRVMVGSQHQMPFPEDEGITVSPGQETFIAVKKVCPSIQ